MLDLNQGIYEHFLRRRGDNSTIRYGVLEDFEKTYQRTATRTNFNPPPGQSALAVLKRPTFTTTKKGQVGGKGGAVVTALASHQCGPGSNSGVDAICGLSLLLGLSLATRGFFPGTPVFPCPQKPILPNSNSIWNRTDTFKRVHMNS